LGAGNCEIEGVIEHAQDIVDAKDEGFLLDRKLRRLKTAAGFPLLCQAKYWRRVWIVQEIMVARKIKLYYGDTSLDWASLDRLILMIKARNEDSAVQYLENTKDFISSTDAGRIVDFKGSWNRSRFRSKTAAMNYLVGEFATMESSDVRDKIFALSGLLEDANTEINDFTVNVDYSLSTGEVLPIPTKG
jgi:hypothetical protein